MVILTLRSSFMSESIWVDHHADYAGRAKSEAGGDWTPRKRLICFLVFALLGWSLLLSPFFLLG